MSQLEALTNFFETHKKRCVIVLSALLLIFIGMLIFQISVSSQQKKRTRIEQELLRSQRVPVTDVWLLPDPLPLPGIQFSRDQKKQWGPQEQNLWYSEINEQDVAAVGSEARRQIDALLESVP